MTSQANKGDGFENNQSDTEIKVRNSEENKSVIEEMPNKPNKTKKEARRTENSKQGSDSEDESHYTPKIRFLQLFHGRTGSLSEDEAGNLSGNEGFIEDEMVHEMTIVEEDLYPDLSPPDYDNTTGHIETGQEPITVPDNVSEEQKQEWKEELDKVEGEIATLKQVLGSKVRYATELKRKLGITPIQELKSDFQLGVKTIKDSETYQKTNEKLHQLNEKIHQSQAYQKTTAAAKTAADKTSAAVSSIVSTTSKKLGDIRNSQTFKSVEDKVGSAYASVKAKVSGSKSEGNFEEALLEESNKENATGGDATTEKMPEEKVPL